MTAIEKSLTRSAAKPAQHDVRDWPDEVREHQQSPAPPVIERQNERTHPPPSCTALIWSICHSLDGTPDRFLISRSPNLRQLTVPS